MIVFAFDRDQTINVNEGPVPLGWVVELAKKYEVWAIGNQLLVDEAGIRGIEAMAEATGKYPDELRLTISIPPEVNEEHRANFNVKTRRLALLTEIYPDASLRIVVDDLYLGHVKGWHWYNPEQFVALQEALRYIF